MQAKVKKKMQQDPPEISVEFHTVLRPEVLVFYTS
jgi:hypothetical protein